MQYFFHVLGIYNSPKSSDLHHTYILIEYLIMTYSKKINVKTNDIQRKKKEYNLSDFGVSHLVMTMCRIFSCVVGRGFLL